MPAPSRQSLVSYFDEPVIPFQSKDRPSTARVAALGEWIQDGDKKYNRVWVPHGHTKDDKPPGLNFHHTRTKWAENEWGYNAEKEAKVHAAIEAMKEKMRQMKVELEHLHKKTEGMLKAQNAFQHSDDGHVVEALDYIEGKLDKLKAEIRAKVQATKENESMKRRDKEIAINSEMTEVNKESSKMMQHLQHVEAYCKSVSYETHFNVTHLPPSVTGHSHHYYTSSLIAFLLAVKALIFRAVLHHLKRKTSKTETETEFVKASIDASRHLIKILKHTPHQPIKKYRPDKAAMDNVHDRSYRDMALQLHKSIKNFKFPKFLRKYAPKETTHDKHKHGKQQEHKHHKHHKHHKQGEQHGNKRRQRKN